MFNFSRFLNNLYKTLSFRNSWQSLATLILVLLKAFENWERLD